jgi:hypothetical protein
MRNQLRLINSPNRPLQHPRRIQIPDSHRLIARTRNQGSVVQKSNRSQRIRVPRERRDGSTGFSVPGVNTGELTASREQFSVR